MAKKDPLKFEIRTNDGALVVTNQAECFGSVAPENMKATMQKDVEKRNTRAADLGILTGYDLIELEV